MLLLQDLLFWLKYCKSRAGNINLNVKCVEFIGLRRKCAEFIGLRRGSVLNLLD